VPTNSGTSGSEHQKLGNAAELTEKPLSQLVNSQRQPIHITKYRQLLIRRHGYPLQDFFGGTSNAGTTKNKKFKLINS
jgi:hypothetical protein